MATIPAKPTLTPVPTPLPQKGQVKSVFTPAFNNFIAWTPNHQQNMEDVLDWIETVNTAFESDKSDMEGYVTEAAASATGSQGYAAASAQSASEAESFYQLAQSVANYVGLWSGQSGALDRPATVFHADSFWALNVDLTDIAASEPTDNNADWQRIFLFQTEEPVLSSETLSVNEESSGSVTITNYNADLEYTAASLNTNIATVSVSGGLVTVNGLDITDATNKSVQVRVTAKAPGIPISNPAVLDVTVVYVPVADDGTIQVVDFSAETEFNDGFDQI